MNVIARLIAFLTEWEVGNVPARRWWKNSAGKETSEYVNAVRSVTPLDVTSSTVSKISDIVTNIVSESMSEDDQTELYWRLLPDHTVKPCSAARYTEEYRKRHTTIAQHGEDADPWRVNYNAVTIDGTLISVSTVFLGMAHGWDEITDKPFLFETLILGGPLDEQITRYTNWEAATAGHWLALGRVTLEMEREQAREALKERRAQRPKAPVFDMSAARKIRLRKKKDGE